MDRDDRVARRAPSFNPSRRFAPWLAAIATNLATDWIRTRSRYLVDDMDTVVECHASSQPIPEQVVADMQRKQSIAEALSTVPERLRQAVLMRYFQEISEAEMASSLGVPKGTVKSRLHSALKSLRETLEDHSDAN